MFVSWLTGTEGGRSPQSESCLCGRSTLRLGNEVRSAYLQSAAWSRHGIGELAPCSSVVHAIPGKVGNPLKRSFALFSRAQQKSPTSLKNNEACMITRTCRFRHGVRKHTFVRRYSMYNITEDLHALRVLDGELQLTVGGEPLFPSLEPIGVCLFVYNYSSRASMDVSTCIGTIKY